MASFMSNFFPGGKDKSQTESPHRPGTPTKRNSFLNPASTPQGSPSKRTVPPGAHDLPVAFDNAMNLNSTGLDAPIKLGRPQSVYVAPLSPGKSNAQPFDDSTVSVDDSVIHKTKSPGSPTKKKGQENTPPVSRLGAADSPLQQSHAALSRQQPYEQSRPTTATKKFNTSRGLTAEEREILQRPNVRRLVNVTQLCTCSWGSQPKQALTIVRLLGLLLRPPYLCRLQTKPTGRL